MRILFTGAAPWVNSGYGKPYRYLVPRLTRMGHNLALACYFGFRGATSQTTVKGAPLQLYSQARACFFNDIIEFHYGSWDADVCISLQDVWTLEGWGQKGMNWCPRFPIDTHPVSEPILEAIEGCHTPIALTRWGQKELQERGFPHAEYIPHGVDLSIYRPSPQAAAREACGFPQDVFIAGMVAANASAPSRKSFPEVLQAWQRWRDAGNDGLLYLHTTLSPKRESGMDFPRILATMGLDWSTVDDPDEKRRQRASVLFPSQHKMWCGAYDDEELATLYNSLDVLLSPSMAEGFGIPIVEAQGCGIPVVTLKTTSMPELTFSGKCLDPVQPYWEPQGGWRGVAPVSGIQESLEWASDVLRSPKGRQHYSEKARVGAEPYDFDRVIDVYWKPFLERLEEELSD